MTTSKRLVEVFSAGCPVCLAALDVLERLHGDGCDVRVLDMNDPEVASRASDLGVRSVPAVLINGTLAECCVGRGPDEVALRAAILGTTK